jgi:hypothetical protein
MAAACSMFRGKLIGGLGFSRRGEYICGRAVSGGGPGGLTPWWRGRGLGHAALWCGRPLAPLRLIFGLCLVSGKIGGSAFVSSNSENISCVAFLKHKKMQKTGNWHSGISLIGYFRKMHKNATKCNKTQSKRCINKHGASKIIDTFETY